MVTAPRGYIQRCTLRLKLVMSYGWCDSCVLVRCAPWLEHVDLRSRTSAAPLRQNTLSGAPQPEKPPQEKFLQETKEFPRALAAPRAEVCKPASTGFPGIFVRILATSTQIDRPFPTLAVNRNTSAFQ